MSEGTNPAGGRERRSHTRYAVDLKAVAVRLKDRLLPHEPAAVQVEIKDISQVALRWHSKEVFYRGELVGLHLRDEGGALDLKCVVRIFRTRRISGQYEVVGFFLKVAHDGEDRSPGREQAADSPEAKTDREGPPATADPSPAQTAAEA